MSDRIRGQETTLQVVVDGQLQAGSFAKVEDFEWNPRQDLPDSDFLGETESDPDFLHHGYEMKFSIHEKDNSAVENVLQSLVDANANGTALPKINLVFIKRYRDASIPTVTLVFQNVRLKFDGQKAGGRKDYLKTSFSGKCKKMRSV